MNLTKQLGIIAVLVILMALYLSQTYFSPQAIEARNIEFYQSLALEARETRQDNWQDVLNEFSGTGETAKKTLWADDYWLKQKDSEVMTDFNAIELGAQARAKARQQIALGLVAQYVINLNRLMLENNQEWEGLEMEITAIERGLGPFEFDFGWQETNYFSSQEINLEASALMNNYWINRLHKLKNADSKECWRLEAIKLVELNSLLTIIETV